METITKEVRCSDKKHRISVVPNGPVILHDHTRAELAAERILVALGGKHCRCLRILQGWRNKQCAQVPSWARPALIEAQTKTRRRRHSFLAKKSDPLVHPLLSRLHKKVIKIAEGSIQLCSYRIYKEWDNPTWIRCYFQDLARTQPMKASIQTLNHSSPLISVILNLLRWYNHVYKHGLAVVSGFFVLDVLSQDENGYTVLAGRQNKDISINVANACINVDATGVKTLQWLDDTKGG